MQADRYFGGYRAFDVSSPRSQFIIGCMATKGYVFDFTPADCDSHYPLPTQPTCYAADNWLDWIIDKFRSD